MSEHTGQQVAQNACMLTEGCIGEAGHDGSCIVEDQASAVVPGFPGQVVRSTFTPRTDPSESQREEIPAIDLVSRDGVPIPNEGVPYTVIHGPEGEEVEDTIVLHTALTGLNVKVSGDSNQSQAATFASFAIQAGFTSEAEITEKYPSFMRLQRDRQGKVFCRANKVINSLKFATMRAQATKAANTMRAKGALISDAQRDEALRLCREAEKAGLDDLRKECLKWVAKGVGTPFGGDLSEAMSSIDIMLQEIEGSSPSRAAQSTSTTSPAQQAPRRF